MKNTKFLLFLFLLLASFHLFAQDLTTPVVTIIQPDSGQFSSCTHGYVEILVSDESGVYRPSLFLTCFVNSRPLAPVDSSMVSIWRPDPSGWLTYVYFPMPGPFVDGDSISLTLAPVRDFFGNTDGRSISWWYIVDLLPPVINPIYPMPGEELSEPYPVLRFSMSDRRSGVSRDSSFIILNGDTIHMNNPAIYNVDSIWYIPLGALGIPLIGGSGYTLCINAADNAKVCGANRSDTCFSFSVEESGPVATLLRPSANAVISCPDTGMLSAYWMKAE
jgi:hypothetical protein